MAINGSDCIVFWEYFCSAQTEKPSITFPSFHSFVFTCHIKWQLEKPLVRIWHAKQISLESFCVFFQWWDFRIFTPKVSQGFCDVARIRLFIALLISSQLWHLGNCWYSHSLERPYSFHLSTSRRSEVRVVAPFTVPINSIHQPPGMFYAFYSKSIVTNKMWLFWQKQQMLKWKQISTK